MTIRMVNGDMALEVLFADFQAFQQWPVCTVVKCDSIIISQVCGTLFVNDCWNVPSTKALAYDQTGETGAYYTDR